MNGTPRTNSMNTMLASLHDRQARAAPERQQHAERQREDDPDDRCQQRNENAAPEQRIDDRQTEQ